MNFLMVILTGIKLKSQLNASSLKQKFIKQNKQLFGNEIYLRKLSISKSKKVKIHDSWYISLKNEFDKEYWINLSNQIPQEFIDYEWSSYWFALTNVVQFKREVYRNVLIEFLPKYISLYDN